MAIYVSEKCKHTFDFTLIKSGRAYKNIPNGVPVSVGKKLVGETRDMYDISAATADGDIYITITPEVAYDESKYPTLDSFVNEQNELVRVAKHITGDTFAITANIISGVPDITTNKYIKVKAEGWETASSETGAFAELLDISISQGKTLYSYVVL